MGTNYVMHQRVAIKEYEAFSHLLSRLNLHHNGSYTSFENLANAVTSYLCDPEKRINPKMVESGVFYSIFEDRTFQMSLEQLSSINAKAEGFVRGALGDYLYAFALDQAIKKGTDKTFVENGIVHVDFEYTQPLAKTITFSVRLFYPYRPMERPSYVIRGDEINWRW